MFKILQSFLNLVQQIVSSTAVFIQYKSIIRQYFQTMNINVSTEIVFERFLLLQVLLSLLTILGQRFCSTRCLPKTCQ